ncbi:hypothetical protein [Salinicola salarius]|nr:hypothetical protein [Salinicola salarius]
MLTFMPALSGLWLELGLSPAAAATSVRQSEAVWQENVGMNSETDC